MSRARALLLGLSLLSGCGTDTGGGTGSCTDESNPSAPNVAPNPGFECGDPPTGWNGPLTGTLGVSPGRSGNAAKVSAKANSADQVKLTLATAEPVAVAPLAGTWCVSAWLRGTAANGVVILRRDLGGGSMVDEASFEPLAAEWKKFSHQAVIPASDTRLFFAAGMRGPQAGQYVEVDDVQVWKSASGSCTER